MMIFTCNFSGYYPVGAAAVIVAETEAQAETLMREKLDKMGLSNTNEEIQLTKLDITQPGVDVLLDGDY